MIILHIFHMVNKNYDSESGTTFPFLCFLMNSSMSSSQ